MGKVVSLESAAGVRVRRVRREAGGRPAGAIVLMFDGVRVERISEGQMSSVHEVRREETEH